MEPLEWLALGLALGNSRLAARVVSEVPREAFTHGKPRLLWAALAVGREEIRTVLLGLGVTLLDGQRPADAILERVRDAGRKQQQRELAERVRDAAALLGPDEFAAWLARETAAPVMAEEVPAVAGKIGAVG